MEMASAFVQLLFDALVEGQQRPQKKPGGFVKMKVGDKLAFQPEAGLRSFTVLIEIRTASGGFQLEFRDGNAKRRFSMDATGMPVCQSSRSAGALKGGTKVQIPSISVANLAQSKNTVNTSSGPTSARTG